MTSVAAMDMIQYIELVNDLATKCNGSTYVNSGPEHARVVVSKVISTASKTLAVYAGTLSKKVHADALYIDAIDRLGSKAIRVVVTNPESPDFNHGLLCELVKRGVEVRKFPEIGSHLMVGDDNSFRVEHDLDGMKAYFAFGGELPKKYLEMFNRLWDHSDKFSPAAV